jgi:predicted lysophospholipase L1 biosynthesis ABC-type transport system permease subunit
VLVAFGESVNSAAVRGRAVGVRRRDAAACCWSAWPQARRGRVAQALGFVRRQVAAAVCWQATAVALVGIAVGAPVGIATGKVLWRVFATNFGVVPVAVVEPVLMAALVAGVLAAANLLAAIPALLAARSHPARLLRAE